jgi:endonuclease-3
MSRNKRFKILEDEDEDYIPPESASRASVLISPKAESSSASPSLSRAKSVPLAPSPPSLAPEPSLKKTKTGVSTGKKRKHITITSEDDSTLDSDRLGSPGPVKEPKNWREVISLIEEAREGIVAPVDVVGADSLGDWDAVERGDLEPRVARFRTLLSLMLSSQTKDQVTAKAMANLSLKFAPLSIETMLNASEAEIDKCIEKVGFHSRKAIYIKKTVEILHTQYKDDVPSTIAEITQLPGVGPKMGFLLMQIAWKNVIGIGVDTHVHRISNRYAIQNCHWGSSLVRFLTSFVPFRLHWVSSTTPEETRIKLEKWLPREYWGTINKTLVGYGQTICLPIGPKCGICPVNHLCPSSTVSTKTMKL